ncbi:DNA replication complex GINS protein psf-3 [Ophiocordyceps sinensis CO18]|uniref:DNA replication complex GINS protein PSF3 n=1 Tax=Ophiocordyceps sinensis (strain Co18 / CGMCC 3.14243) TaxID=911162 RepID=T5ALB7_OPHSC|nr:DNA replication complex GINS protein psf-3 [Ophiocordyceps sinensis CO18]
MSYYDVDAILTDAEARLPLNHVFLSTQNPLMPGQKVPCQFELDVPYLGHLDSSSSTGLKPGTSLSLPLWLAEMLALAATGADARAPLTLNLPPCLSERVTSALKADPRAVALRDQNTHFYGVGVRMLDLFDERDLAAVLRRTFVVRAADVGLHARKADEAVGGSQSEEFLRGLDDWERVLFRRGHEGVKAAKGWMDKVKRS